MIEITTIRGYKFKGDNTDSQYLHNIIKVGK